MSVAKGEIMKIYNQEKTEIIENPDLEKGYLKDDTRVVRIIPEQTEVKEQFHYEYKEYPNGGKDRIKVIDIAYRPAKPETYEYEDIKIYKPYTKEEYKHSLRAKRERECFSIVNRGQLWYDTLTENQKIKLKKWYIAWLDVTDTLVIPDKPDWI